MIKKRVHELYPFLFNLHIYFIEVFQKINRTKFPPNEKPMMVWDGDCGFCKYWVVKWRKITGTRIDYKIYQEVFTDFEDIPKERFQEAVRLIDIDGMIYNGPEAAYRSLWISGKWYNLFRLYRSNKLFRRFSDYFYDLIAQNRPFFFWLTKIMFGTKPDKTQYYWLIYLVIFVGLISILVIL